MTYSFGDSVAYLFTEYAKFINVDLTVSLMDKNNKLFGRNITILVSFQDTLYLLLCTKDLKDSEAADDRKKLISKLRQLILSYISANTVHRLMDDYLIQYDKIYETCNQASFVLDGLLHKDFISTFTNYYISYKDFYQFIGRINLDSDVKEKFKISGKEYSILVQAILEFNNMMAHLLNAIRINDNDALNNYAKAKNHLFRASLDHYKMLIRLIFLTNTEFSDDLIKKFGQLRAQEFCLIGHDIRSKNIDYDGNADKNILECYKEIFNEMLALCAK